MAVGDAVGGRHDDGNDLPPVDVAQRGVLAANELVDRLVRSVDGDADGADDGDGDADADDGDAGDGPGTRAAGTHFGAADELLHAWMQVVRLGIDTFGRVRPGGGSGVSGGGGAAVPTIDTGGAASGVVHIDVGSAEVWLHNRSHETVAGVALHCGDLRAADGSVLPAASVHVEPAVVDLPARSSRGIAISVDTDLPAGLPAGTFRGVVLASGIPEAWLPIEVVVTAPRPGE